MRIRESSIELDPADLASVPMFPLSGVVLLPGALLPLHLFEPRYRDMGRDVLAGSRLLALARLQPGHEPEYYERPPVHLTIGVGIVLAADELDDGRYNILVRGLIRARVAEELAPDQTYRVIRAQPVLDSDVDEPTVVAAAQQKLIAMCDQLSTVVGGSGEQLRELVRLESSPGGCADMVGAALVTDVDERQILLEARSPLVRLERVMQHVAHMLTRLGADDGLPN